MIMMEYLENASRNALQQIDSRASDFWSLFCQTVQGTFAQMKNRMGDIWQETNDKLRMNDTFQQIQGALNEFGNVWYSSESLDFNPAVLCITAMLVLLLIVSIVTLRSSSTTDNAKRGLQKDSSSPAKVLSIFELAKTAYIDGHMTEVMKLVDRLKFDVNFPIPTTGMSLLLCACISGERKLVHFLLKRGGDISAVNTDGDSCLYLATFAAENEANDDLLELLIKQGCKVNGQNYRGNTPLHLAASRGNVKLIQTLLSYGADPQRTNNVGIYPFDCANNAGHMEAAMILKTSMDM